MGSRVRRLVITVGSLVWLGVIGRGEAVAQLSKLLEFGPDALELAPPARAVIDTSPAARAEPVIARERPWILSSASELRLPPPPDERAAAGERLALRKRAVGDDAAALERVRYWGAGSPRRRWDEMLADLGARARLEEAALDRASLLLDVAIHDGLVAAWDSKRTYRRPGPGELDARLVPEVPVAPGRSYPCEWAVVAGAAAAILAHLFPADAPALAAAAHEAASSRVAASAVYPSDAEAGLALGRAVAARVIDYARLAR